MDKICIAIDGPAGSGKSTVAKLLATKLNYIYLDTGAMYRCITLACLNERIDLEDEERVTECCQKQRIDFVIQADGNKKILLNHQDVTDRIRLKDVTNHTSLVSSYKSVRQYLVNLQQQYILNGGIIMDGRDIGTVVMPNAELKIFMNASIEERAKRRHLEQLNKGIKSNLDDIKLEIQKRDDFDSTRTNSPLRKAADAIEVNTTNMTIEDVVSAIYTLAITKRR